MTIRQQLIKEHLYRAIPWALLVIVFAWGAIGYLGKYVQFLGRTQI